MLSISLVVPVFNDEKYIRRCIDSILSQTHDDFELLLVDDGSSDNCAKICDEYALENERVIVLHQKNTGVSVARNHGISLSGGRYLAFVDSDDYIDVNFLRKLYNVCINNGVQMACCDYYIAEVNRLEEKNCCSEELSVFSNVSAVEFYAGIHLTEGNSLFRSSCARLVCRDIVLKNMFPTDRVYAEDAACVYLWLWNSDKVAHLNYCGYYYCQNSDSICHRVIDTFFVGNFLTEEEWIRFFEKNHFPELFKLTVERYYFDAGSAYRNSKNNPVFRKILRKGLIRYSSKAGFKVEGNEYYFELAFPLEMRFYWYYQAIKSRLKGK